MNQPTEGGRYVRDPETGELTRVARTPVQNSVPASETDTHQSVEKAAPVKRGRNV